MPGSHVGLHHSHTSAQAQPAPGSLCGDQGGGEGGSWGCQLAACPSPKVFPSKGTPVIDFRLCAATLPAVGPWGE